MDNLSESIKPYLIPDVRTWKDVHQDDSWEAVQTRGARVMVNVKIKELFDLLSPHENVDLFVKYDDEHIMGKVKDIIHTLSNKVLDSEVHYIRRTDTALEILSIKNG